MIVLANIREEPGVYRLRNTKTHKKYLGSSKNLRKRMVVHKSMLKNLTQKNKELNRDCQKYGSDSFVFEVIKYCDSKEESLDYEKYLLDMIINEGRWHLYYNDAKDSRSSKGRIYSVEHRRKICKPVRATSIETGEITDFPSATEAEKKWPGVRQQNISACCRGELKTSFKCYWEYL